MSGATQIGFLLIDDFSLMSYASVIEPFRAANRLSGEPLYAWKHYSASGGPVRASNGLEINVDDGIAAVAAIDVLFVCAGGNPSTFRDKATLSALRRLALHGATIGGVSGGPFILAAAGVLDGYRATIHWEHEAAFAEAYPRVDLERGLYIVDRARVTCAGGTAGLDLAIELISRSHGEVLGRRVGDWFIRTQDRDAGGAQRGSVAQRYRVTHSALVAVLSAMEAHLCEPLSREQLAGIAGTSLRHLERLFAAHLRTTVREQYLRLRLDAAMRLLRETGLSRTEVAMACGFVSASHFTRVFSERFAIPPSAVRRGV